ncbi:MAG: hypothetical protein K6F62_05975 [Schwartzia sp.]|nr:hypothetical protein [Schwartzia sp. (in: firmicutes)]
MKKRWVSSILAALVCAGSFLAIPSQTAYADNENEMSADEIKASEEEEAQFVQIYKDASYIYYLDKKNMQWVDIPFQKKRMLDVWIKLVPLGVGSERRDANYRGIEDTYYLEHYYIRKDRKQIQFLCELEINGRPNNDVETGKYDPRKWENLVPESIEDHIYHGVVAQAGASNEGDLGDFVEDVFRIAL